MKQIFSEQVAAKLHICVGALFNRRKNTPHLVPPARRLPGTKRLIWIEEEVDKWIIEHAPLETPAEAPVRQLNLNPQRVAPDPDAPRRPRGRPRKLSQLEQRGQQQQEGGAA